MTDIQPLESRPGSPDRQAHRKQFGFADGVAAVSSLVAGAVMAWREVLSESYANFTSLDLVDDIKEKYRKNFGPDMSRAIEKGEVGQERAVELILQQNCAYNTAIAERFDKAGFSSFSNRMKLLNTHERWKIGLTALAVTGVTMGSLLILSRDFFADKGRSESDRDEHTTPALSPASFVQAETARLAENSSRTLAVSRTRV